MQKKHSGFTLIELMVVIVIIGILLSIAIPAYMQYVRKARLKDLQSSLMTASARLETSFSANNGYPTSITIASVVPNQSQKNTYGYQATVTTAGDATAPTFLLTGTDANMKIWAGINGSIKCSCIGDSCINAASGAKNISGSLTESAVTCPANTNAF